jgi:hypothetical protein
MYRFVLEGSKILHSSQIDGNPYVGSLEFFNMGGIDRVGKFFEEDTGGWGRYYIHSKLINGQVRILVFYSPHIYGNKDILSGPLEALCLELCANNTRHLDWWFKLEESLKSQI